MARPSMSAQTAASGRPASAGARTATCSCAARARRQLPALRRASARRRPARSAGTAPVSGPAPPPVPAELETLMRRMRLPYLRKAAPDVLATARAQRWDPAEVLRVLLAEEVTGRDAATRRTRRTAAGFGREDLHHLAAGRLLYPRPPRTPWPPWNGSAGPRTWPSPGRPGQASHISSRPSRTPPSTRTCGSPGSPSNHWPPPSAGPGPTDRLPGPSPGSAAAT